MEAPHRHHRPEDGAAAVDWRTASVVMGVAGLLTAPLSTLPGGGVVLAVAYVVLGAAVVLTVLTGIEYVRDALALRRTSARTAAKRARRAEARP